MSALARRATARQILAIGLDAAEPRLIERWCKEGRLPAFARLRQRGVWRRLHACTEISSGAVWPSLNTGTNPAKHGMGFFHRQLEPGTYRIRRKYADQTGREPYWRLLSEAGKRVAVLDVPDTCLMPELNGVQLVGWGMEGLNAPPSSSPAPLMRNVRARFGRNPLAGWYQARPRTLHGWQALKRHVVRGAQLRTAIARHVYQQEPWDFFIAAYAEPHWAGHLFWHLMDPTHPEHDPEAAASCGDAILEVYQAVDRGLAALLECAPQATVLVFSSTGMGPNYSGVHLLPEILRRLGMGLDDAHPRRPWSQWLPARRWGPHAIRRIEDLVSPYVLEQAKRFVPARAWDRGTRWLLDLGNDWPRSRAFAVPSDRPGAIRINRKGREPQGLVEPGRPYDAVCDELTAALKELVNVETGRKAVVDVVKAQDRYHGEHLDELPDLIVNWADDAPIRALFSPRIGTVRGELLDKRTGGHTPHGFLLAVGPGIRRNAVDGSLPEADIMDVAPTVLSLLGQPAPEGMDGRALDDLLEASARTVELIR